MKRKLLYQSIGLTASTLALGILSACGGGAGTSLDVADGGIRGTGSSVGPVSGFGSVFVNGVKFDTDSLGGSVGGDDGLAAESRLQTGMVLEVQGEWFTDGTGEASGLTYDDTLRGEILIIQPWDIITKTAVIEILGRTVHIDGQTVIKGKAVVDLANGDFVRISGWRLPNGEFRASYLGLRSSSNLDDFDDFNEVELEGDISSINTSDETFNIGSQVIFYGGAEFTGLVREDLAVGVSVEVEGNLVGGVLQSNEIERDDFRRYTLDDEGDIEFVGPVSSAYNSSNETFTINGLTVRVTPETEFDDALSGPEQLVPGLLVQVEGDFESDGTITAEEIELREADSEVEAARTSEIDYSSSQLRIGGVLVQVSPLTIITDDDDETRLTLGDLQTSLELKVEGVDRFDNDGSGYLEALVIERGDDAADGEYELTGRITEMVDDRIRVLGLDVFTTTDTEFDDISKSELQALVDSGQQPVVEVEYQFNGARFEIQEIELDEDDDD
ncbi:DUF5666 domain-containing protein [Marinobacter sp.]|uniref:DUF5666 domain-containing protein n=1 Tax=Marinobacter sp. TaxID=50741 RepID=UPI00356A9E2B